MRHTSIAHESSDLLYFPNRNANRAAFSPEIKRIAIVGNFPPTKCGIATFTQDMVASINDTMPDVVTDIYAMVADKRSECPPNVRTLVLEQDRDGYRRAGIELDRSAADVVWLQHEFGLFGGESGEWIIDMLRQVAAPLVVTLHTVLENPTIEQRRVMDWLVARASRLVVMSKDSRDILARVYGAESNQIAIIPHGVPDRPFGRSEAMKAKFGLSGKSVLMTFGLISPGKGIEVAIDALPAIVEENPDAVYCIVGATHPKLLAFEGEAYRDGLLQQAKDLGVEKNLVWVNRFLDTDELLNLIEAADVYLTPYGAAGQSTSGTLSYALALGKAIVSTPYKHAAELLDEGRGVLIPFGDSAAIGEAVNNLLVNPAILSALQERAYAAGRETTWPVFGKKTVALCEELLMDRVIAVTPATLSDTGLMRLTDSVGIMQHSVFSVPDRAHGYCVDDNARALMLSHYSTGRFAERAPAFAAFVQHSWNPDQRSFRNFMGYDRRWLEDEGSTDSNGRALWALGVTLAHAKDADMRGWAKKLWVAAAPIALDMTSLRALSFAVLGADKALEADANDTIAWQILERGLAHLDAAHTHHNAQGQRWFEPYLAYDNGRLSQAMLRAAIRLDNPVAALRAMDSLSWITHVQTESAGHFRPIGSQAFGLNDIPGDPFDQQAVDAWAMVDAAAAAFSHTRDKQWLTVARQAYAWFFGANDRGLSLVNLETGSCYDGVRPRGLNYNQGAESVLSLHLAQRTLQQLERSVLRANEPHVTV